MTDPEPQAPTKRERLAVAAAEVLHEQGVEKTTLADIARVADVPVGNVYYYYKTKNDLVEAAIDTHARQLARTLETLEAIPDPADRLKSLIAGWVDQRDVAARFGCPTGTLAAELDKRGDGPDASVAVVMGGLVDWVERQFVEAGRKDARELAIALVSAYQGVSLLTNTFRDPELMAVEGRRLQQWVETLIRDS